MGIFWALTLWSLTVGNGIVRVVSYEGVWRPPTPTLDRGFVVAWHDPTPERLTLYGPDGHKRYELTLDDLSGAHLSVASAAVEASGAMVLAARRQEGLRGSFGLLFIDAGGRFVRFVDTGSYWPTQVCIADDQSVWTAGFMHSPIGADFKFIQRHARDGAMLGSFVTASDLGMEPGDVRGDPFGQVGGWILRAAQERIGVVGHSPAPAQWLELDLKGKVLGRWNYDRGAYDLRAFTASRAVYAQTRDRPAKLVVLDRETGKWVDTGATVPGLLLGADGKDLVYWLRESSSVNVLLWVRMRSEWD